MLHRGNGAHGLAGSADVDCDRLATGISFLHLEADAHELVVFSTDERNTVHS